MKMTSRFMACPCALTACRQRSATPRGESIAARRSVALMAAGMVSRGAMSQRCLVADRPAAHPPQSFSAHDGESGGQWRAVTAFTTVCDGLCSRTLCRSCDRQRNVRRRGRRSLHKGSLTATELPAATRAREEVSVACVPVGHDRHLHGEHERERPREKSHGERCAAKKFQDAKEISPGQWPREAERRQNILRHWPGEASEELHIAVIDDDRSRAETDDGVAVGRNALVEPAQGGKYQPFRIDCTFRARVHGLPPGGCRFARGFYPPRVPRSSASGRSTVRMSTSDVSVRWTGHLSAISKSRRRCSASSAPGNVMARSMRSIIPSLVSQSSQSAAWIRPWRSSTVTRSSGSALRSA